MPSKYPSGFCMTNLLVLQYKIYQLYSKIKKEVIDKVDIMHFFNRDEGGRLFYSFYLTTPLIKGSHFVIDYYTGKDDNPKDIELHLYEHYKYTDHSLSIIPFIINNLLGKELKFKSLTSRFYCFFKGAFSKKLGSDIDYIFRTSCEMNIPRCSPYNLVTPEMQRVAYFNPIDFTDDSSNDLGDKHISIRADEYFQSKFGQYTSFFKSCEGAYDIYAAIIDSIILMMDFYGPWDIHFETLGS